MKNIVSYNGLVYSFLQTTEFEHYKMLNSYGSVALCSYGATRPGHFSFIHNDPVTLEL